MFDAAAAQGLRLDVDSAYRSFVYQTNTFDSGVARLGEAQALRGIAKPGFSEHQTGLAADTVLDRMGELLPSRLRQDAIADDDA